MIRAVIFDMYETLITHYNCPLYFSVQMAADAGIPKEKFQPLWHASEYERTVGKVSFEEIIARILRENQCYTEEIFKKIVDKRIATKEECFRHLHAEIIPMLSELKKRGILVGLISNCFSEEAAVIRKSVLFPYFNAICLSYEQGVCKPDEEIFYRCMNELAVKPEECIYVGDGGSYELEAASELGMKGMQAVWYFKEETMQGSNRNDNFIQLEKPLDLLKFLYM